MDLLSSICENIIVCINSECVYLCDLKKILKSSLLNIVKALRGFNIFIKQKSPREKEKFSSFNLISE